VSDDDDLEASALVRKIAGLAAAIAKLPSLSPSPEVNALFMGLVTACIPPSTVDVEPLQANKLSAKANKPSATPLPSVALGTGPTGNFSRPRFFAEHPSSRLSAQAVLRAHSGPSAKKVAVNGVRITVLKISLPTAARHGRRQRGGFILCREPWA
jgi:hypothetical protein